MFIGVVIVFGVIALLTVVKGVRIIQPFEKGVVTRLGKYRSTLSSGINFIIPFIDEMISVDMREEVVSVEPQQVITKDNVGVVVDAVIYAKVIDPVKAEFEIQDFEKAATTLAQTSLRNLIGDKTLDETLIARDNLNVALREILDEVTHGWGVKITRVELQRIDPPTDITEAMSKQMKAEREKRATILEAEGFKQSQILRAEGDKTAKVLKAEGEAQALKQVSEAAEKYFKSRPETLRRLEVLENVLSKNTKFVIPSGSETINLLNLEGDAPKVLPRKKA
ncbi:MAG: SPFH domain-containing protein [Patescibacteria group bacterium]